jgi:hypothetical protein
VLGLRDPGSAIDLAYPSAVVGERFFKGSGTSQAAAVTSGAVALLLSKRPTLTPDQVKKLLTSTAAPIDGADAVSQGAGVLDVNKAAGASLPKSSTQLGRRHRARLAGSRPRRRPRPAGQHRAHRREGRLRGGLEARDLDGRHHRPDQLDRQRRTLRHQLVDLGMAGQLPGRQDHHPNHHLLRRLDRADVVRADVVGRHLVGDPVDRPDVVKHPLVTTTTRKGGAACPALATPTPQQPAPRTRGRGQIASAPHRALRHLAHHCHLMPRSVAAHLRQLRLLSTVLLALAGVRRTRGRLHAWMSALAQQLKGSTRRDGVNFDEEVVTD